MDFDVIVVGGSFAGLSAALQLARTRRTVGVFDTGAPRNRFSEHAHGFYAHDGDAPLELQRDAREKVLSYPTVHHIESAVTDAQKTPDGFVVNNGAHTAKKLVLAYGITDILPDIPGVAERWGKTVLHCPYCHGYEAGGPLGVITSHAMHAALIADWGPTIAFTNGEPMDDESRAKLRSRNIQIIDERVSAIQNDADILLASGRIIERAAVFVVAKTKHNAPLAEQLGCAIVDGMMGPVIKTDDWRTTTVPGVFAAGDIAREPHNATWASADGVTAGVAAHRELALRGF